VRGDGYWEWITRHMGERDRRMVLLRRDGASLDFIAKAEGMHLETVRRLVLNALKCSPIFTPHADFVWFRAALDEAYAARVGHEPKLFNLKKLGYVDRGIVHWLDRCICLQGLVDRHQPQSG
jgi:hypothetical protein